MTTAELAALHAQPILHPWRLAALCLLIGLLAGVGLQQPAAETQAPLAPPPVTLPVTAGTAPVRLIDHSVLADRDRLPEAEPSPLSVGAYGD